MELTSRTSSRFWLVVSGYQYPGLPGEGPQDWDANWLIIQGEVELPDGRRSSFVDPCLTTWEADDLGAWLRRVSRGEALTAPDRGPAVEFLEPNLGFRAMQGEDGRIELRVYLSLEAEPPWVMEGAPGVHRNYVTMDLTREQLADAAEAWLAECREFPARP